MNRTRCVLSARLVGSHETIRRRFVERSFQQAETKPCGVCANTMRSRGTVAMTPRHRKSAQLLDGVNRRTPAIAFVFLHRFDDADDGLLIDKRANRVMHEYDVVRRCTDCSESVGTESCRCSPSTILSDGWNFPSRSASGRLQPHACAAHDDFAHRVTVRELAQSVYQDGRSCSSKNCCSYSSDRRSRGHSVPSPAAE